MVTSLTVLYDADCPLCRRVRRWLEHQDQLVPLLWVACGSEQARHLLPGLDHDRTRQEVTVVADTGEVWTAEGAWITCLWATRTHRRLALWLSHPARRSSARHVALAVAARRPLPRGCDDDTCPTGGGPPQQPDPWVP